MNGMVSNRKNVLFAIQSILKKLKNIIQLKRWYEVW